jgi:predicted transcriptional regulator
MSGVLAVTCLLFVPLVIRRFRKNESFNKGAVLTYITNNPGCTAPELARDQKMNIGTARYHVHRLQDEGKIILSRIGKYTRLFVNKSTYDDREKLIASCLRNDTCLGIVSAIMETPGINNQKLSEKLGMEKSLVYRHMQKLLDDNIVTFEWEGKNKLYYISMDSKETLIKLMPLHYQCPGLKKE